VKIIKYEHFGNEVSVMEDMKGKHKDFCLCYKCSKLKPDEADNCKLAQLVYDLCRLSGSTLVMWECKEFERLP